MANWITVTPIVPEYNARQSFEINFDDVNIEPIPDWLRGESITKDLSTYQRMRLEDSKLMFSSKYTASSYGDSDPSWKGEKKRSIQEVALEKIIFCNLALWLAQPSPLGFEFVLHIQNPDNNPLVRHSSSIQPLKPHYKDARNSHAKHDYALARKIKSSIHELERRHSPWMSARALYDALTTASWETRFLFLWIALEALFGTDTEIIYRLSHRIGFFLSDDKSKVKKMVARIKSSYGWRSKIVHGLKMERLKTKKDESAEIVYYTESYLRESLTKILLDKTLVSTFSNEKQRNEYLDNLIFSL